MADLKKKKMLVKLTLRLQHKGTGVSLVSLRDCVIRCQGLSIHNMEIQVTLRGDDGSFLCPFPPAFKKLLVTPVNPAEVVCLLLALFSQTSLWLTTATDSSGKKDIHQVFGYKLKSKSRGRQSDRSFLEPEAPKAPLHNRNTLNSKEFSKTPW